MKKTIKILLVGGKGRLGKLIAEETTSNPEFELVNIIGWQNSSAFLEGAKKADVIIDVSNPLATVGYLKLLQKSKTYRTYIIGCTGWDNEQTEFMIRYSKVSRVVYAPNFSSSVNILLEILENYSNTLKNLGYTAVISETHHAQKKDKPSGTAKAMVQRLGKMKTEVHAVRAGKIVGTHDVKFIGPYDCLTFSHEALDRKIFAIGALNAARWAIEKTGKPRKTGLFSMNQILRGMK